MTQADGTKVQHGAGNAIALPVGWKGAWRVIKHVQKLYVIMQE